MGCNVQYAREAATTKQHCIVEQYFRIVGIQRNVGCWGWGKKREEESTHKNGQEGMGRRDMMHNDSDSDDEGNERKKNEKDRLTSCMKREIVDSVDCFSGVSNLIYYYYYAWTL